MGRLERKLLSLLLLLTILPLAVVYGLSERLFERALEVSLTPQIRGALSDSVEVFGAFVRAEKARQRAEIRALLLEPNTARAAQAGPEALEAHLDAHLPERIQRLVLTPTSGGAPVEVLRPLGEAPLMLDVSKRPAYLPGYVQAEVTYSLERRFFERFRAMEEEVIRPVAAFEADRENIADILTWSFIAYLTLVLGLAGGVALLVGRRITKRLSALKRGMEAVAGGALNARVPPSGRDEIADLTIGFNEMARALEESQERVEYLTQMSAWQGIARKLAHEIKNPLTPILLSVQQLHQSYRGEDPRYLRTLEMVVEVVEQEVRTLRRLVENFSRFARLPQAELKPEDLVALARDVAAAHPEVDTLTLEVPDAPVVARADRSLLRQVLTNLIKNGVEACAGVGSESHVALEVWSDARGVGIAVEDGGPGVPEDKRERIFEPYVTDKDEGTGLGLAIVKKIVLDHDGRIEVGVARIGAGGGARFEIRLPKVGGAQQAERVEG